MKRPLEDNDESHGDQSNAPSSSWWNSAVNWVRSNGGNVHSAIISKNSSREPVVVSDIPKDTVLLEIPTSCVVSRQTVEATHIGRQLAACIRAAADNQQALYTPEQDLLIALYLACQVQSNQPDVQVYLDTLPDRTDYNKLPRRWNDEDLENLLTGSCLLDRVRKCKLGLRDDYSRLNRAAQNQNIKSFPTFSTVDDMLAAVTSRAFAGLAGETSDDIAMVILLDLCNHHRGPRAKNVSYQLTGDKIVARAYTDLKKDDTLRITYGAQGNPQLLLNYGFCIPNNVEPDGSSNDVFDFVLKEGKSPVELRTGPKSYTYGSFVKALELFHQGNDDREEPMERPDMDDMEAFLNECEDEDGDWDEEEGELDHDEGKGENLRDNTVQAEIEALTALHQALEQVIERYTPPKQMSLGETDIERFAKILISSELRTLRFYVDASQKLIGKLTKQRTIGDFAEHDVFAPESVPTCDDERLEWQVNDLVDAFLRIRFSNLD